MPYLIQAQFTKSYTSQAIFVLILYFFLWIPGLIANIVYLVEASRTRRITGINPEGFGCLWSLICFVAIPPPLLGAFLLFLFMLTWRP